MVAKSTDKGQKKGILRGIADFLAPEQPVQAQQAAQATQSAQVEVASAVTTAPNRTASTILQGKGGVSNPKMRAQLLEAIAAKNRDGLDFFEFNKALDKDKTVREQEKYNKVFGFMQDMSHDGQNLRTVLLETGQYYLSVLDEEKAGMEQEFKTLEDDRVGEKKAEIEQASKEIEDLERQKQEIEQNLQERRLRVAELQDQVSSDEIALQRQRSDFYATFDELYLEYQTKLKNIEQFIPTQMQATSETTNQ